MRGVAVKLSLLASDDTGMVPLTDYHVVINDVQSVNTTYRTVTNENSTLTVVNGDKIQIRANASSENSVERQFALNLGGVSGVFRLRTEEAVPVDDEVDGFSNFEATGPVTLSTGVHSETYTVRGLSEGTTVQASVASGQFIVTKAGSSLGVSYGPSDNVQVGNGDVIHLRVVSSTQYSTSVTVVLTLGNLSASWTVTTVSDTRQVVEFWYGSVATVRSSPAAVAQAFYRVDPAGLELDFSGQTLTSSRYLVFYIPNTYTVSRLVAHEGTVNEVDLFDSLTIRSYNFTHDIGGRSGLDEWSFDLESTLTDTNPRLYLASSDRTPNSFDFEDQEGLLRSTLYETNEVTLGGFTNPLRMSTSRGSLIVNGGSGGNVTTVRSGDRVKVEVASSSFYSTQVNVSVRLNNVQDSFHYTTIARPAPPAVDMTPDAFTFSSVIVPKDTTGLF